MTALTPLLVRFGRIGDMVLQTPLLHLLHARYGRPCRVLSAGPWSTELFRAHPDVGAVWQLRARHRPFFASPERWRIVSLLRGHDGPVYVSEDIPKQVTRIRALLERAGVAPARCVFLDIASGVHEHWVDRLLRFGGVTPPAFDGTGYAAAVDVRPAPQLFITLAERDECRAWLRRRGGAHRPVVLLQPGNKRTTRWKLRRRPDPKQWPEQCWTRLLRSMRADLPDATLLLCGAPAEAGMLARIGARAACGAVVATDELPLRRMLALMSMAHSMVAVDTGPAHMAAAMGCPLVVVYGAESPVTWARRSPSGSPVVELGGPPEGRSASEVAFERVLAAWRALG